MRGKIHYLITGAEADKDFLQLLSTASKDLVHVVRVSCLANGNSVNNLEEIAAISKGKALFFMDAACSQLTDVQPDGLFFHDPEEAMLFQKNSDDSQILAGLARTYADCKNLELANADYVLLKPKVKREYSSILGMEAFSNLIPKNETYGWMITNINTPVIAAGLRSLKELEELKKVAGINGIQISAGFEPQLHSREKVEKIHAIFA